MASPGSDWSTSEEEDALVALLLTQPPKEKRMRKRKKKREMWVRPWVMRRSHLGAYTNLLQELAIEDHQACTSFLRMNIAHFNSLLEMVTPLIVKQDTVMREAISPGERLAVTLRFLASGNKLRDLQYLYRIPPSTLSLIIHETCDAIYTVLKEHHLQTPQTEQQWQDVADRFYNHWQFPNCIGALDGKHIAIQAPTKEGSAFFNYKGFHSIILLALVDAEYKFLYVDVGANGRSGDAGVFLQSTLLKGIEEGCLGIPGRKALPMTEDLQPHVIVGDDAFPLKKYLLKPYPDRVGDCSEVERKERRVFDYRLSRARRCAEHAFGILVQRFGIFKTAVPMLPERVTKITLAAICLHNFLLNRKDAKYLMRQSELAVDTTLVPLQHSGNRNSHSARSVRDSFKDFVNGVGKVPWQEDLDPRKS